MRKILALVVTFALIICSLPVITISATTDQFAGGIGSRTDPYLITTKQHLNNVRNDLYAYYKLAADIIFDAADFEEGGEFYNDGALWIAIGETTGQYTESFMGTFDGDGHSITGLKIRYYPDGTAQSYGLFGDVSGTIKNLSMVDVDISLTNCTAVNLNVGSIAGSTWESTITHCSASGTIFINPGEGATSAYVGGLIGYLQKSTLENCFSIANIVSKTYFDRVGGICGSNYNGFVRTVYNTGSVIGAYYCGGIAGEVSYASVTNAYNTGTVKSEKFEGFIENAYAYYNATAGIGGYLQSSEIARSYNVGLIESESACGIASEMYSSTVSNCYYIDLVENGSPWSGNKGKCTEAQMHLQETFINFDFDSVWIMDNTSDYPYPQLQGFCSESTPDTPSVNGNTTEFAGGTGTEDDPYVISTKEHLNNVRNYLNAYYIMIADIEFSNEDYLEGGDFYNDGQGWQPIGSDYFSPFTGWFNGNGHTISNFNISITNTDSEYGIFAGLFGYGEGCVIENLTIDGKISVDVKEVSVHVGSIIGYNGSANYVSIRNCVNNCDIAVNTSEFYEADVGGIAGGLEYGTIENANNTGNISANHARIGGIIAYIAHGYVKAATNTGKIESDGTVGGVVASAWADIINCDNTGSLYGADAGGICANFDGTMKDCQNTGSVNADYCAGGLVGCALGGDIQNSHNYGVITATVSADTYSGRAGGLVAANQGAIVQYCTNSATVLCTSEGSYGLISGGIVGYSTGGKIFYCKNLGDVYSSTEGSVNVGGIVGCNSGGSSVIVIDQCLNEGDIFALKGTNGICGGIAGDNYDSVKISNCYNTGNIQSSNRPGGIIGLSYNGLVTIEKCYSIGNIETTTPYSWTSGTDYPSVTNCYYLNTEDYSDTKIVGFAAGTALMLQEMESADAFAGFDFDTVWTMAGNPEYPYPELRVFCKSADGDVNSDGILDTTDVRLALKSIVGLIDFAAEQTQIADMNEDGKLNSADIRRMLLTITATA